MKVENYRHSRRESTSRCGWINRQVDTTRRKERQKIQLTEGQWHAVVHLASCQPLVDQLVSNMQKTFLVVFYNYEDAWRISLLTHQSSVTESLSASAFESPRTSSEHLSLFVCVFDLLIYSTRDVLHCKLQVQEREVSKKVRVFSRVGKAVTIGISAWPVFLFQLIP